MDRFGKTTEGIEFVAFVDEPAEFKSCTRTLCIGETVQDWLKKKYSSRCNFGMDSLPHGYYKEGGWKFDLRPFMRKYIYTDCGSIYSAWAPNVTCLRSGMGLSRNEHVALAPDGF